MSFLTVKNRIVIFLCSLLSIPCITPSSKASPDVKVFDGLGVAASKVYYSRTPLSVGGSAEFFSFKAAQDTFPVMNTWKLSPHLGYRITPNFIFNSRFTIENSGAELHGAGSVPKGQVRTDFVYIDLFLSSVFSVRLGQQLLPIGFVNQRQDGIFYYSTYPPEVETELIPSTWSEHGLTVWGVGKNFHYQLAVYNSLDSQKFAKGTFIKGGRQNGQFAKVDDVAGAARLDYVSPWVSIGASGFIGNTDQGNRAIRLGTTVLAEVHLQTSLKIINFSALVAEGQIRHADSVSLAIINQPDIPSKVRGYYVTAAIDLFELLSLSGSLPVFVRHSQYNLNLVMPTGATPDPRLNRTRTTLGINYKPKQNIAFKADYQIRKNQRESEANQISFGISLSF